MQDPQARHGATGPDLSRQAATTPDNDFTLSIDEALERYAGAGHPRTPRSVQRYCAKGHIEARLIETPFGEKWLITPDSVDKHIAYIEEVTPSTSRDMSRHAVTGRDNVGVTPAIEQPPQPSNDTGRQVTTTGDADRYVQRLESENEFLRGQIGVKDGQIKEMTERARETNVLIAGLQKMLSPLLGAGDQSRRSDVPSGDHQDA